jgi:hypothetical protein
LFGVLKQHLQGQRFHSNEEVEMAVGERLRKQEQNFFRDKEEANTSTDLDTVLENRVISVE